MMQECNQFFEGGGSEGYSNMLPTSPLHEKSWGFPHMSGTYMKKRNFNTLRYSNLIKNDKNQKMQFIKALSFASKIDTNHF